MRTLDFDKAALKELSDLPAKQYRQVVGAIFDLLREPQPHFSKQLSGYPYFRLAVGEYRVISSSGVPSIYSIAKKTASAWSNSS